VKTSRHQTSAFRAAIPPHWVHSARVSGSYQSSKSVACIVFSVLHGLITTTGALICRSAKMPRNSDEHRLAPKVRWSTFVRSVAYATLTNVGLLNGIDHTSAPD
jgi:hypothetical protein